MQPDTTLPANTAPFWGHPTSSLEWCEDNYAISPYVCEFWNTLSSLYISSLAMVGLYLVVQKQQTELCMAVSCIILGLVGLGSALFHGTLLYTFQLLDELPMIYGTLLFLYCCMDSKKFSKVARKFTIPFMMMYGLATTLVMLTNKNNPMYHQVAYAALVFTLVFRSAYISYSLPASPQLRRAMVTLFWTAICTYLVGYASWVSERHFCKNGYAIPFIQLHAIWHILTGTGTFIWIQHVILYRYHLQGRAENATMHRFLGLIPYVLPGENSQQQQQQQQMMMNSQGQFMKKFD
eukprot:TRINITY_DN49_c0_g1_i4.p1 TRINITY_DN49_c0_g1~~TRINITY_DN49_c0_g1_i4.p1  ORF type:complete len:293 (+),score=42.61 TRINITY_DN49_c0_g1_i4:3-881(+)